jgi:D-beta-D-heptose 7-phosphate kinase/D-beta-D-heptose 1-phosphate adenosyltransferase
LSDGGFSSRASGYIGRFPAVRILVVGDIILDEYVWGSVGRISPEAPVPVVAVTRDTQALGGAGNVAVNVSGLGAAVSLAGIVGADASGRELLRLLRRRRIGASAVVTDRNRPTTTKTRVIAHHQQVVRVDRERKDPPDGRIRDALRKTVRSAIPEVDGVVLSDYRKGALSRELVEDVVSLAGRNGAFVVVDPKRSDFSFYRGCTVITPNKSEAEAALGGRELSGDLEILSGGKALLRKCGARAILITRGEEGMSLVERGGKAFFHIPAQARQVFDVTGAGDTVIGTLAVGMGAGAPLRDAALLANLAAGVVVGEVGTVPITIEKLAYALLVRERDREIAREGGRVPLAKARSVRAPR